MIHVDQKKLELLYFSPDLLSNEEKSGIEKHLMECSLCRENALQQSKYYDAFNERLGNTPTERDFAFGRNLSNRQIVPVPSRALEKKVDTAIDAYAEIIEPSRRSLPERFVRYVRFHPVGFASGLSLAAAVAVLAVMMIRPTRDLNPSYARAKDEFLVVYNSRGEEVWRKHIGPEYVATSASGTAGQHPDWINSVADVDGDGKNEVVSIFGVNGYYTPISNTLQVFNADGTERWKYSFHRQITFGTTPYADDYAFRLETVGDYLRNGSLQIIALAAQFPWIPNAIVMLNARDGTLVSEYWHPGTAARFDHKDIDRDGIDELFFSGKNSFYNRASLLVLDPRAMTGHSPVPEKDNPPGIGQGTEKYYVLFPASDLEKLWLESNFANDIQTRESGLIDVVVYEQIPGSMAGELHYYFDSTMTCVRVSGSNSFIDMHQRMEAAGKITGKIDDQYYASLQRGVLYWDGDKLVREPTMNRHYLEALKMTP